MCVIIIAVTVRVWCVRVYMYRIAWVSTTIYDPTGRKLSRDIVLAWPNLRCPLHTRVVHSLMFIDSLEWLIILVFQSPVGAAGSTGSSL